MKYITSIYQALKDNHVQVGNTKHTLTIDTVQLNFTSAGWLIGIRVHDNPIACKKVSYNNNKLRFKLENGLFYNKVLDNSYNNIVE
jgi:hypothetical protein